MATKLKLLVVCATFLVSQTSASPVGFLFTSNIGNPELLTNDIQPGSRDADRWWSPTERGWPSTIVPWGGRSRRSAGVVSQDTSQTSSRYIQSLVRSGPSPLQQGQGVPAESQRGMQPLQAASPLQQQGVVPPPLIPRLLHGSVMPNSSPLGMGSPGMVHPSGGMVTRTFNQVSSSDPRISGAPVGLAMGVDPRTVGAPGMMIGPPMGAMMNPMALSARMVPDMGSSPPGFQLQRDSGGNLWLVPIGGGMPRPLPAAFMQ